MNEITSLTDQLERSTILDLRNGTNHPLSLRYSEIHSFALIQGDIKDGRVLPGLDFSNASPFYLAAKIAVDNGLERPDTFSLMHSALRKFYLNFQPMNAAKWLGINTPSNTRLSQIPPWGGVLPWRARTQLSYQQACESAAIVDNASMGRQGGVELGWQFCGPVSDEKIAIESERILVVLKKIARYGFQRNDSSDGDVRATALVNEDNKWRWLVSSGNHRAAAAAALGYDSIPIRINLVISRNDVLFWKHVVEGLFTYEEALFVFDNVFHN
ncbi:hypothetical protein [Candidatus Pantoea formicae]|uniref:hypothetical protein n=1 Tax=Candidatus Pantoea formicae TaxID=2608355 RepID=UPI003EDA8FC9